MSSDTRSRRTCRTVRQQRCETKLPSARQPLSHSSENDVPELIVSDTLPAPIPIGPRELDVIETYLDSLLADVIGGIDTGDKT